MTSHAHRRERGAGRIVVALCDDTTRIVLQCRGAYVGRADAKAGDTIVTIPGVKPGAYAIDVYHDANGDGAFNFPAEGYAYGNEAAFPPSFPPPLPSRSPGRDIGARPG